MRVLAALPLILSTAGPVFADMPSISSPIVGDLADRENTFGPERCGGLLMLLLAEDLATGRATDPNVRLAFVDFLERGMQLGQRDQATVMDRMKDYATAYKAIAGGTGTSGILERDATYCKALSQSIGRLP